MRASSVGGGMSSLSFNSSASTFSFRGQTAMLRPPNECKAMSRIARRGIESTNNKFLRLDVVCRLIMNCWYGITTSTNAAEQGGDHQDDDDSKTPLQYTLVSNRNGFGSSHFPFPTFRQRLCFLFSRRTWGSEATFICFADVNKLISSFVLFTFRTSYFVVFFVLAIIYFGFTGIFAFIYLGITSFYPECVSSAGEMIGGGEGARLFADCFQLSWQTFGTVGYGSIYPATGSSTYYVPTGCVFVGVLGSFEAYLGVLYAGIATAILFRKVLRSQNYAQAIFSDPIVVRFGKKELEDSHSHDNKHSNVNGRVADVELERQTSMNSLSLMTVDEEVDDEGQNIPCPSLEFRIVNRLHDVKAGEIVEAKLDCVAIIDHQDSGSPVGDVESTLASSSTRAPSSLEDRVKQKSMPSSILHSFTDSPSSRGSQRVRQRSSFAELTNALREANKKEERDAFHDSNSKQPNMFTSITLEDNTHPNFNRTWYGRHRLDENSPLLTPAVRNRIKNAGGYWPADMNDYLSIKRSLHFRHILVCLSGISNATAATVYAQKVYDLVDVNVGYRFVPMNYRADDGSLRTDEYLLNAVCEQRGGRAEPFQ